MTIIYDPHDERYLDEADTRAEMSRVFDVCGHCRKCVDLCTVFPTLFEMLASLDDDAGRMTPAQQDEVVGECLHCGLCAADCPYVPALDPLAVDVPRLMLRAGAMRVENKHTSMRAAATAKLMARTNAIGKIATSVPDLANRVAGAKPGSAIRKLLSTITGVSAHRRLPSFAKQRFSSWFGERPTVSLRDGRTNVTVFPTCIVDYQEPAIGHDLVKVYERNGIECSVTGARCCGAPSLHAGDADRFAAIAERNVEKLAAEVRSGNDIVVPQPACGHVIRHEYPVYVTGDERSGDATLVAAHTFDAVEYLMRLHRSDDAVLDTDFSAGHVPPAIVYHAPSHVRRAVGGGVYGGGVYDSRDLLMLTGARVTVVTRCSGVDGIWGLRAENDEASLALARRLGDEIDAADGGGTVSETATETATETESELASESHLANTVILEQTGRQSSHPLQILARAYGIAPEH